MITLHCAEYDMTAEEVEGLREIVIQLRDNALSAGKMDWAVSLSHAIAYMAVSKEVIFEGKSDAVRQR